MPYWSKPVCGRRHNSASRTRRRLGTRAERQQLPPVATVGGRARAPARSPAPVAQPAEPRHVPDLAVRGVEVVGVDLALVERPAAAGAAGVVLAAAADAHDQAPRGAGWGRGTPRPTPRTPRSAPARAGPRPAARRRGAPPPRRPPGGRPCGGRRAGSPRGGGRRRRRPGGRRRAASPAAGARAAHGRSRPATRFPPRGAASVQVSVAVRVEVQGLVRLEGEARLQAVGGRLLAGRGGRFGRRHALRHEQDVVERRDEPGQQVGERVELRQAACTADVTGGPPRGCVGSHPRARGAPRIGRPSARPRGRAPRPWLPAGPISPERGKPPCRRSAGWRARHRGAPLGMAQL